MKQFWWGVFFCSLFGIILLAPETDFAYRLQSLSLILTGAGINTLILMFLSWATLLSLIFPDPT